MKRVALCALLTLTTVLAGCAGRDYPVRDDHDHTPGPPLMPVHPPQSDTEGG